MGETQGIATTPQATVTRFQYLVWGLLGLAAIYACYQAVSLAWCSDDAFISFRYSRNLVDGLGLVYNAGERVEAYTNFLWTILMAGGMWLGFEPVGFSQTLSVFFYSVTAGTLVYASIRLTRDVYGRGSLVVPLAALGVLLHHDMHVYATSGLETSMVTALITTGVVTLVLARTARHMLLAGVLLVAAVMTRPDAAIAYVMATPFVFIVGRNRWRDMAAFIVPLVVIYLPYWLVRYDFYGYPFPNSYYAKSASEPYYEQGFTYVWLYFKTYYPLLLAPLAAIVGTATVVKRWRGRILTDGLVERAILLTVLVTAPFVFYVVRVGGDFMFARFLIPATPLCFLLIEAVMTRVVRGLRIRLVISLAVAVLILLRIEPFSDRAEISGIVDERAQYPPTMRDEARADGAVLRKYLSDLDVSVAYYGTRAMLVFYSEVPTAHEAAGALTDEHIAHLPIPKRGRPGHEKSMPYYYLVSQRINFIVGGTVNRPPDPSHVGVISFDGVICHIVTYQDDVMDALKQYPQVQFLDFRDYLERYLASMDTLSLEQLEEDHTFLDEYYFSHNHAPELEQRVVNAFRAAAASAASEPR